MGGFIFDMSRVCCLWIDLVLFLFLFLFLLRALCICFVLYDLTYGALGVLAMELYGCRSGAKERASERDSEIYLSKCVL